MAATQSELRATTPAFFVPDLCRPRAVLAVVLIVELVAIIFAIARQALHSNFWIDLAGDVAV